MAEADGTGAFARGVERPAVRLRLYEIKAKSKVIWMQSKRKRRDDRNHNAGQARNEDTRYEREKGEWMRLYVASLQRRARHKTSKATDRSSQGHSARHRHKAQAS